jgi:hypothetical protein
MLDRLNVVGEPLDHAIVQACAIDLNDQTFRPWLDAIEERARRSGSLATAHPDLETA